jgi:hypothetical protein
MVRLCDIGRGHRAARNAECNHANINREDSGSTAQESAITVAAPSGINDHLLGINDHLFSIVARNNVLHLRMVPRIERCAGE